MEMNYTIYTTPPADFCAQAEAAGCYFEWEKRLLLLRRHASRPQGNTWGVPAGKLEQGETPQQAVIREVFEEVGLDITRGVQEIGKLYIQLPHIAYVYHMFYKKYETLPEITLSDEHTEARWVTHEEALKLPLIAGGIEALEYYQKFADDKTAL